MKINNTIVLDDNDIYRVIECLNKAFNHQAGEDTDYIYAQMKIELHKLVQRAFEEGLEYGEHHEWHD